MSHARQAPVCPTRRTFGQSDLVIEKEVNSDDESGEEQEDGKPGAGDPFLDKENWVGLPLALGQIDRQAFDGQTAAMLGSRLFQFFCL